MKVKDLVAQLLEMPQDADLYYSNTLSYAPVPHLEVSAYSYMSIMDAMSFDFNESMDNSGESKDVVIIHGLNGD